MKFSMQIIHSISDYVLTFVLTFKPFFVHDFTLLHGKTSVKKIYAEEVRKTVIWFLGIIT